MSKANRKGRARRSDKNGAHSRQNKPTRRRIPLRFRCEELEPRRLLSIPGFTGLPEWTTISEPVLENGNTIIPDQHSPVSGAVNAIVASPTDPNTVFAATINGGIWVTHNALATDTFSEGKPAWTPLTDRFPSLSFGAIAFDPTDPTNKTLWAGFGQFSNGAGDGEAPLGLLKTTNGGGTWAPMAVGSLSGQNVESIVPTTQIDPTTNQQVILVATQGGTWRSNNGGNSFTNLSATAAAGLPVGAAPSQLIVDPANANQFYVAIPNLGIYRSTNNRGAQWVPVNTGLKDSSGNSGVAGSINARLSIYNSGGINAVYAGFVYPAPASPPKSNDPTVVFRSTNAGGNWTQIGGNVVVHPGNNQANNFALIADRNNANAVYIAGDSQASSPFDANIARGDASTNSWNSVVDGGANNTSPHADARDFSWDSNGDLFFASDGGVYRMINVGTSGQKWQAAVGTMDVHEIYSVGYIPGSGFVFGTQDTGTAEPQIPNPQQSTFTYQDITGGDGNVVAVDSTSHPGTTYVYTSGNSFFTFQVQAFDGTYHQISKNRVALTVSGSSPTVHVHDRTGTTFTFDTTLPFVPPYLLNTVDPNRMLIGSNWLYESTDQGSNVTLLNGPLVGNLPDPTKSTGQIVPLVYGGVSGGVGNTSVIYAASGANFAKLYVRTAGTGMPTQVTYPSNLGGFALAGIRAGAVDPTNYNTAFMADANGRISKTTDAGATLGNWSDVTGDLPNLTTDLRTLTTYRNGSKLYLFVGGAGGVYFADMTGPTYHWRKFGNFLPSVIVKDLHYNAAGDFLYAGTWGRGVWSVSKVSTLLPATPTTLTITGDTGANPNDVFTVSADPNIPNIINVKFDNGTNAYTYAVDAAAIDSIKIMGGAGTDAYNIQNTGLTVPVSIDIGSATASIRVFGATGVNSNTNGAVTITGGTGTATLAVDEQGNTFIGGTINVSTATAGGGITGPTTGNVTYDGTLHLTSATLFTTAGGGQSVNITATGVPTNINPGRTAPASNSDFIFIGTSNSVQSIAGAISIEDLGNFDSIYLNDQADLSTPAITIDQYTPAGNTAFGRIAGLSPAAISFKLSDLYEVGVRTGISLNAIYLRGPGSLIDPTWQAVVQSQPKVTVQNMTLIHGVIVTAAPSFQALNNTLGDSQIVGGTGARLDNNQLTNLAVSGNAVQVTITNNHVSGGVSLTNATNVLFQGNTITGALTATGVSSLQATGNTIGSATLTGTTSATLTSNTVTGAVVLSGGSGNHLDTNTLGSLNLTGGTDGAVINNNSIFGTLSITGGGATNVTIQNNRAGAYDEQAAATGTITGNDFGWNGVGGGAAPGARSLGAAMVSVTFNLNGQFTGSIDHNDIHNGVIGLNYLFPSAFVSNHIFNNATGVIMPVNDTVNGLGFFPGSGANDIYNNTIGVNLTGRMQLQHVYSNTTGVVGSGILGGNSLDTANVIETNITGVDFTGRIQFNRIDSNTTAIITHAAQIVVHNLIYRNTGAGVRTNGANDVRIVNNTFYSTAGNNVQVDGGSSRTELLDNIFQADGGYDVFVADNSRTGFFSDYNDLYSTGPGKLLHYFTDFSDIIDIQRDLGLFDLHSIGTSAVNPGYAQPRFANPATNDFHITALAAGSHASSPTIDAADPLTDLLLPSAYQNLLANPSFDSGTNSWTVNTGGSTLSANPAAFDGSSYFYSGAVGAGFAEQTVSLTPGFTPAQLDAQNLSVVFGGRIRSAPESPSDQGKLIFTFLNGVGNPIGAPDIVPATNATDRWELAGDRLHVPVGTRSVKYRFETLRLSGATDDSYLDGAALYVLPDSVAPDQGAYGNTDAGDINLAAAHVQLITPQLYVDWQPNQPHTISWTTFNGGGSPVRIDVYQDVAGVPQLLTNITASTPDTGSFTWIPQNSGLTYGTFGLRIKVSLVSTPSASDLSNEVFAIPENTHTYYVNDGSTTGDQYTTAIGSNRNTGRLPSEPKPLLSTLFAAYSLGAADTIYVDTGTYQHIGSILISGNPAIGNGQGATITGPTNGGAVAQISSPSVGPTFDINAGNFVTISHLAFSGGQYGVWIHGGSSNFTGSFLTTSGNTLDGVRLEANSSASATLDHLVSFSNGRDGISVGGPGVNLSNSVA
ncbi:MAG: hypothetical protein JWM97_1132, partial [Phycisphaerales bacterium]|nr:hypothetical protein [Phycisphaerales bacterium]